MDRPSTSDFSNLSPLTVQVNDAGCAENGSGPPYQPLKVDVDLNAPRKKTDTSKENVLLLVRQQLQNLRVQTTQDANADALKIKVQLQNEKRCFGLRKPPRFDALKDHLFKLFARKLNIYYTSQGKGEVLIAIRNQDDLDQACKLVEKSNHTCLRLLLSKHSDVSHSSCQQPDASGTFNNEVVQISASETCSSCGSAMRMSVSRSIGGGDGGSTCSSGVQLDSDDYRHSATSPKAPTSWKEGRKIGRGAFGEVCIAHDTETGRDVAMKKIRLVPDNREAVKEATGLEYDVRELGRLQHPRILQYLGVQRMVDYMVLFMEFMPGGSVKDLIEAEGRLSCAVAKKYTYQMLEGLSFLHRMHIVHRDIKPGNVLRDLDGNVKIADFGSGKKLQTLALSTQNNEFTGTIHYTAPEVLLGKTAFGRKADVWSVGVTFVEMLTGRLLWAELEPMAAMFQIAYENPPIKWDFPVDKDLEDLVHQLLDKDISLRPHAEDMLLHTAFAACRPRS